MEPTTIGPTSRHRVYLGLGSNLGDRDANLRAALRSLAVVVHLDAISSVYDSAPQLVEDQPRFHNLACTGVTGLEPLDLLRETQRIERALGRTPGPRYGPRIVDIDLLFYDRLVVQMPGLSLPHPRIAERVFVLMPLAEIAPRLIHPALGRSIAELADARAAERASADVHKLGLLPGT